MEKIQQRRFHWCWNRRLLFISAVIIVITVAGSVASYLYHSSQTAETYRARAAVAAADNDYALQAKWLQRYSLVRPDDEQAIFEMALAADHAADAAPIDQRYQTTEQARKLLSSSIALLKRDDAEKQNDLRRRLIKRLLSLGNAWLAEAERQVIQLGADANDADANKWMATARIGQWTSADENLRSPGKFDSGEDYWNWLAYQKPGEALIIAANQNPADVELIASLVEATEMSLDAFELKGQSQQERRRSVERRIEPFVARLADNTDSRSQWVRYRFLAGCGEPEKAKSILYQTADEAAARLARGSVSIDQTDQQQEIEYWDFVLLSEAARLATASDPELARDYYDQLTASEVPSSPRLLRENVFLLSGQLALRDGNREAALETWLRGVKEVNSSSLSLLGMIAQQRGYDAMRAGAANQSADSPFDANANAIPAPPQTIREARAALKQFSGAIESVSKSLLNASEYQLTRQARLTLGRELETARWRKLVLEGSLDLLENKTADAIVNFGDALTAPAEVQVQERLLVAQQLAALYQNQGYWDQAAIVLESATQWAPENIPLRAQAAEAWTRAGNKAQALSHWRVAGNSDSLPLQVAAITAQLNQQLQLPASQRDLSGIRALIRRARKQYDDGVENEESAQATSWSPVNPQQRAEVAALHQLKMVEILLPPPGVETQDHLRSDPMANATVELAEQYPDDPAIQAFAAERLAGCGRKDASDAALLRLESSVGKDSLAFARVQARAQAGAGQPAEAARRLLQHAESLETARQTERAECLTFASSLALQGNDAELAYQMLLKIPDAQRSVSTLVSLAQLALGLTADSPSLQQDGQSLTNNELSRQWQVELRAKEGESGTSWRSLAITALIDEMRRSRSKIERSDPRLRQARTLLAELLALRPKWGEAIALDGWLLAIEGKPQQAVDQLRRGIEAGDRRMQTRLRLWEQLVLLGRENEVENEIEIAASATGKPLDQYGTARIRLAQRQGEFDRSVEVARQAVKERPSDYVSQLVLARAAVVAAAQSALPESRRELLDEAKTAIEKAMGIEGADAASIASAKLAVALVTKDEQVIRGEIEKIRSSDLAEFDSLRLMSQAYVAIGDFEAALPLAKRADEIQPSRQTQLVLAALYKQLKRSDDEVAALRLAQKRDPDNPQLRNQLAQALAARDGKNTDWSELRELLQGADRTTLSNRFYYAILLSAHGEKTEQDEAIEILRELVQEKNSLSEDATRVLAAALRRQIEDSKTSNQQSAQAATPQRTRELTRLDSEVRALFDSLLQKSPPQLVDVYRYADFLLVLGVEKDLPKIKQLLQSLRDLQPGSLATMEIGVRYADRLGERDTAPELVEQWVEDAVADGTATANQAPLVAASSLIQLGFNDEALQWLKKAYELNPDALATYVVTLGKAGRVEEALAVCCDHHTKHEDETSAILLAELLATKTPSEMNPQHLELVDQAVQRFDRSAALLESVATLRMQQQDFPAAIELYQKTELLDPLRVRTLNNLAMVLSQVPGRAAEGIEPIQRAINLAGEVPELLDTKGVVLMKAGQLKEAERAFRNAMQDSEEPRYRFHLVMVLLAQGNQDTAIQQWNQIDLEKLNPSGLTAEERETLAEMKKSFGT
ncbi:tetratricopeptide repeat protein [Novipirellula artificiosorum]|uniref:tetratricopeptide repeat protein n=1 Tax=Novipirellula artificiosorum TaxID=2528016 RepID=UPI0018CD1C04|nr:tetratricopeptide repeat protein [Novipirellula artificiosorum]